MLLDEEPVTAVRIVVWSLILIGILPGGVFSGATGSAMAEHGGRRGVGGGIWSYRTFAGFIRRGDEH